MAEQSNTTKPYPDYLAKIFWVGAFSFLAGGAWSLLAWFAERPVVFVIGSVIAAVGSTMCALSLLRAQDLSRRRANGE